MERLENALMFLSAVLFVCLIFTYLFLPSEGITFSGEPANTNFSITGGSVTQFYPNMRFADREISYSVADNCSLKKKNDADYAFQILDNLTVLSFYKVDSDGQISVDCEDGGDFNGGFFVAGEGGPTEAIKSGDFYVIAKGKILLLQESECPAPNIAIHEVLHVLGIDHSTNKNNIMYNISKCNQEIGEDTLLTINKLYYSPGFPDLALSDVSTTLHGRYLDIKFTIQNNGLSKTKESEVKIYADDQEIKSFDIQELDPSVGRITTVENLFIQNRSVKEIKLKIIYNFEELNKENNKKIIDMTN